MTNPTHDTIIKIDPALPCATWHGDKMCRKPAMVAVCWYATGVWMMQPVCRDCTRAAAALYNIQDISQGMLEQKGIVTNEQPERA